MQLDEAPASDPRLRRYWRRHLGVVGGLTLLWALAAFGAPWLAARVPRESIVRSADLWAGAGLLPVLFFVVTLVYAVIADVLDAAYRADRPGR